MNTRNKYSIAQHREYFNDFDCFISEEKECGRDFFPAAVALTTYKSIQLLQSP